MSSTMRAVTYSRYAGPEQLEITEVPIPEPAAGQVRLKVEAAALNPYDWHIYRGDPWLARLTFGLRSPGHRALGSDVSGVVDKLGADVTGLSVGDRVFGGVGFGACGELVLGSPASLAKRALSADAFHSAALPMAAATSLAALRAGGISEGARVLVIGASGGVGHIAVQVAKALGASRVVGVCSAANAAMVSGLGADRVIDYTTERIEDCGEHFDLVVDAIGTTSLARLRRVIAPRGTYVFVGAKGMGGPLGPIASLIRGRFMSVLFRVKWALANATYTTADLEQVAAWVDSSQLRAVVQATVPLERAADAMRTLEAGHVAGKLVVKVP